MANIAVYSVEPEDALIGLAQLRKLLSFFVLDGTVRRDKDGIIELNLAYGRAESNEASSGDLKVLFPQLVLLQQAVESENRQVIRDPVTDQLGNIPVKRHMVGTSIRVSSEDVSLPE